MKIDATLFINHVSEVTDLDTSSHTIEVGAYTFQIPVLLDRDE